MTTLVKTFALAGLLLTSSVSLFASEGKAPKSSEKELNKSNVENVVDAYINGTVKGETTYLNQLFDNSFTQRTQSNPTQEAIGKSAYIKHLKNLDGITYQCEVDYQMLEKSDNYSLAKVTLDFEKFTRTDYVTMIQGKNGWSVKEVNSVFKNK